MAESSQEYPGLLHPLSMMRRARGLSKLDFKKIQPDQVPQPYHQLLVHEGDMTSRLESFHQESVRVRRLRSSNDGKGYFREVILETDQNPAKPVEYGAIEIQLSQLPENAREAVVEGEMPLGTILIQGRIAYSCSLRGFFQVVPDDSIREAFALELPGILYGRSNRIEDRMGETIAQIVEILPPG